MPQIEFGVGFDGRKETSFQPVDKSEDFSSFSVLEIDCLRAPPASYNHGSAQNIDIITQFMCDTLVNSCGADQTAQATCANAKAAADTVTAKTGEQADKFNAVFGITTDFAADAVVDDQGNTISPGLSSAPTAAVSSDAASATVEAVSIGFTLCIQLSPRHCILGHYCCCVRGCNRCCLLDVRGCDGRRHSRERQCDRKLW